MASMSTGRLPWIYLGVLAFSNALIHSSVNTLFALVPVFRSEFEVNIEVVGLIVMIPLIVKALASLPSGMLADRYEPRKLIAISLLLVGIGGFVVSQSRTVFMLLAGFSIISLGQTIFHPSTYGIILRLFGIGRRNVALGVNGAGATLGMAIGPISVGLIMYFLGQNSWRIGYLIWVVPAFACSILTFSLKSKEVVESPLRATGEAAEGMRSLWSIFTRSYAIFLILIGLRSFGVQSVSTYMTTYLKDAHGMPVDLASVLFGVMPLMGMVAAPIGGFVADRRGEQYTLSFAYVGQAVMLAAVALSPSLLFLVPSTVLYGFMENSASAPSSALVAKLSPSNRRGTAYAVFSLSSNLAGSLAPIVMAYVVYQLGIWYVFPVTIVMFLGAFALLYLMYAKSLISPSLTPR
jgi:MFS family permease